MYSLWAKKLTALVFAAIIASALTVSLTPSYAQKHGGGSASHGGASSSHGSGDDGGCSGCGGEEGGHKSGNGGQRGGRGAGFGGSGQSLRGIFHDMGPHSGADQHSEGEEHNH